MAIERNYRTGEWIYASCDIIDSTGKIYLTEGEEARIMVFDPSKGETPYGLRGTEGTLTAAYVSEAQMRKNPGKAHLTPLG